MTNRLRSTHLVTAAAALVAGAAMVWTGSSVRAEAPQAAAAKERSVWDGVYSDAQSMRGEKVYADTCASCHAADLTGQPDRPVAGG